MAVQGPGEGESEPVVIDTDTHEVVTLELDSGAVLHFDRAELLAALWKPSEGLHDGSQTYMRPEAA